MSLTVHLLHEPPEPALNQLRSELQPGVTLTFGDALVEQPQYEVLVAARAEREHLEASPVLRALIIPFAGLPHETRALLGDFPHLTVHNLHHNAGAVAEMTIALLLAAAKSIVPCDRALRRHDWRPRYASNPAILLEGKTALILGYGAIGKRVACLCRGLGMDVIATRRRATGAGSESVYPPETLWDLLPRADVLIVTLPLTAETEGLIGHAELGLLPPSSVLVNVGRGPVVDEEALYHALQDGTVHAAGLDVWYAYPGDEHSRMHTPPSGFPFHELDNVVMSPHRAGGGGSVEVEERRMAHLARLLNAAATGLEIPDRVDIDAGY